MLLQLLRWPLAMLLLLLGMRLAMVMGLRVLGAGRWIG